LYTLDERHHLRRNTDIDAFEIAGQICCEESILPCSSIPQMKSAAAVKAQCAIAKEDWRIRSYNERQNPVEFYNSELQADGMNDAGGGAD